MYEGHHFIKLCDGEWVFDITEFLGYKVVLDKDKKTVKDYKLAFTVVNYNKQIQFEKHIRVPAKVLKSTVEVIEQYEKEALLV